MSKGTPADVSRAADEALARLRMHGYASDADLVREELARLRAEVATLPAANEPPWDDRGDEWTTAIEAAHPTRTGSHPEYMTAMRMVGNRRSKDELVDLVNWLLWRSHALEARVRSMAEVPCAEVDKRHPMRCFPRDKCSFCRARDLLRRLDIVVRPTSGGHDGA